MTGLIRPSVVLLATNMLLGCIDADMPGAEFSRATIPVNVVNNRPLVEVRVNGMPIPVVFDLGSAETLRLHPSVLEKIEKVQIGDVSGVRTLYGSEAAKPVYQVELVQFGDLSFSNAKIMESFHDAQHQAEVVEAIGAYGSVGLGFFQNRQILLNFPSSEMTIIRPDLSGEENDICYGDEIPMLPVEEAGVLTEAQTEIGNIRFVWDTGAVPNILFKSRADRENLSVSDRNIVILKQVVFNTHDIGPLELKVWDFPVEPPFEGIIGHVFFRDHIVCVDLLNRRLMLRE